MLALQRKPPEEITALGESWELNTDFRFWIDYPKTLKRIAEGDYDGYTALFKGNVPIPCGEVVQALNDFFYVPSEIPRSKSGENLISYDYDADYIYASFLQAYGVDLVDEPLHWHKFVALLTSLPEDTMMSRIMSFRAYKGNSKTPGHRDYMRLKNEWSLPTEYTEEEKEEIEKFDALFG